MSDNVLFDKDVKLIQERLNLNSLNQKVISGNLANINTPGYAAKELSFEGALEESIQNQGLQLAKSDGKHMDSGDVQTALKSPEVIDAGPVDLDHEMVNLSKNRIEYEFMVAILNKKFSGLKDTIQQS